MKKIYLMRHGETLFNTMDVNQGQCLSLIHISEPTRP